MRVIVYYKGSDCRRAYALVLEAAGGASRATDRSRVFYSGDRATGSELFGCYVYALVPVLIGVTAAEVLSHQCNCAVVAFLHGRARMDACCSCMTAPCFSSLFAKAHALVLLCLYRASDPQAHRLPEHAHRLCHAPGPSPLPLSAAFLAPLYHRAFIGSGAQPRGKRLNSSLP